MPERDRVMERVDEILRAGARLAYLGVPPVVACHGCGEDVEVDRAFSGQADGRTVYFCPACNLKEEGC